MGGYNTQDAMVEIGA